MKSPFAMRDFDGKEILSDTITKKESIKVITACLALAIIYGIDRVEQVIKNTYCQNEANQIIGAMNLITKTAAE